MVKDSPKIKKTAVAHSKGLLARFVSCLLAYDLTTLSNPLPDVKQYRADTDDSRPGTAVRWK